MSSTSSTSSTSSRSSRSSRSSTAGLPSRGAETEELQTAHRLGVAMSRLMRAATRAKAQDAAGGGVFHSFALLVALKESGPVRSTALAEAVFSDPSTISRQVAALVDHGLVVRQPDPDDRRATLLAISDAGLEAVAHKLLLRDLQLAQMTADWSSRDRARLADLLDRFSACFAASVTDHGLNRPHDATRSENS